MQHGQPASGKKNKALSKTMWQKSEGAWLELFFSVFATGGFQLQEPLHSPSHCAFTVNLIVSGADIDRSTRFLLFANNCKTERTKQVCRSYSFFHAKHRSMLKMQEPHEDTRLKCE